MTQQILGLRLDAFAGSANNSLIRVEQRGPSISYMLKSMSISEYIGVDSILRRSFTLFSASIPSVTTSYFNLKESSSALSTS